jgi:DNA invertase Pin-like site-specific DNA recombinase
MTKQVAIYARVSTDRQTSENQLNQLRAIADKNDWVIVAEFVDEGISGAKGRDKRPEFDALMKGAVRRQFDLVMSWSVDRLGRSLQHLVEFLDELHSVGCDLYLHQQAIDTTTPAGKMMFQMCGVFSEFERSMIRQRVKAGLERAVASGKKLGRPRLSDETRQEIQEMRASGMSVRKIAAELGISVGAVCGVMKELSSAVSPAVDH